MGEHASEEFTKTGLLQRVTLDSPSPSLPLTFPLGTTSGSGLTITIGLEAESHG